MKPNVIELDQFKKIFVIAFGKAALTMTDALLARLPQKLNVHGVCSAPKIPKEHTRQIRYFAGGHPLPNKESFAAAKATLSLLKTARKDTFIFFLISGGGSAMHELPLNKHISLEDTIAFHEALVASGATITEVNTVRKYFSAVKGGRLALAAPLAEKLTLLLADVPLKDRAAVASSPTLPDESTLEECREILSRYRLLEMFPFKVREHFAMLGLDTSGVKLLDRPAEKSTDRSTDKSDDQPAVTIAPAVHSGLRLPGMKKIEIDPAAVFGDSRFITLLSNHDFVNAARERAEALGFKVVIDNSCDDWDYAQAAHYLLERFHALRREYPRLCLLSSGEVTVRLGPHPGCGGRNQQLVLTAALDLAHHEGENLAMLSAGSDGIDGDSPAAGATVDPTTIARARSYNFDPEETLAGFNTCTLFTALGDSIVTGPTGNNLRDLRVLLAVRDPEARDGPSHSSGA
ncbi:D-glycerate 2-kinase [Acidisarcina polymorpha]|uniref:D-glycerate 2-kinase n=1 Tax=Acidisarcina polymorpha TaxID=2211140 RepID=A0A2Z5G7L4_9BACT|nr:D-glycerate 2-kinase [Acidisarcina polymorpha]